MTKLAHLPLVLGALLLGSCRDPNVPDLNNPLIDDLEKNPTAARVATAAQGLLVGARTNIAEFNGYVSELGVFGRESYIFDPGDNRFETELLGPGPLDPAGPRFGGNLWVARFSNIRAANIVLNALDNSALTDMVAADKEATRGFVQTIQALDFLEVINTRDTIGAPIELTEVSDAPALGCAILAAHGAGRFATIEEGCKAMVRRRATIEPDSRRTQLYECDIYPRYNALYGALKSIRNAR